MSERANEPFEGGDWNFSFAGCGFSSVYYLGALSCILERAPHLVQRAAKFCGASSGCLVAASLAVGIPIETCCEHVMSTALAARKHHLSVLHPAFSLLRAVQDSLLRYLPPDAHRWASGRLCVSLTRASDGANVLVTEFDSREELIQVLLCSCFFPVYCGLIPPSYRGVRYVDGALSNNIPLVDQRNTITMSPFCGEADICPREGTLAVLAVHYGDLGIQVSSDNVNRIFRSFFPPKPEKLAEMGHNGYMDALHFLRGNDLLRVEALSSAMLVAKNHMKPAWREGQTQEADSGLASNVSKASHQGDWWLKQEDAQTLPAGIQKVLCKACRESRAAGSGGMAPPLVKLFSFLLIPLTWSVELIVLVISLMTSPGEEHRAILEPQKHACHKPWPGSEPSPGGEEEGLS